MQRRIFLQYLIATGVSPVLISPLACAVSNSSEEKVTESMKITPLEKSDAEWRELLSSSEYEVLFKEGTEPSRSSALNKEKRTGTFICAACHLPLFSSDSKYESGTGWPSFWQPIVDGHIETKLDFKIIYPRTEYHCARCGGHQGHVFKDGPKPTGLRYCNNGLALNFIPEGETLPALRS